MAPVAASPPAAPLVARARRLVRRYCADKRGVAAIEFAFVVPIMFVMFVGAVELSQAITVDRRVTQAASSIADLAARKETSISQAEIGDIMKISGYIMIPYSQSPLQVVVRNVTSSSADASTTKQSWQCTFSGAGANPTPACTCMNDTYNLPAGLVSTNDSVVVAEVSYTYTPLVFDYFLNRTLSSGAGGPGTYTLSEKIFMKPRGQAAMLLKQDGQPCPSPTF
ncbi:MAG: pilus assembly protein [Hyphomonadaceae bacterium]|jgi:Flp pilus assembly protein TadG|nr:pilus assembly protein [Hyphomonadaceae bacterium]